MNQQILSQEEVAIIERLGKMIIASKNIYQFNNNGNIKTIRISERYDVK